jgi:hypothetical protein
MLLLQIKRWGSRGLATDNAVHALRHLRIALGDFGRIVGQPEVTQGSPSLSIGETSPLHLLTLVVRVNALPSCQGAVGQYLYHSKLFSMVCFCCPAYFPRPSLPSGR